MQLLAQHEQEVQISLVIEWYEQKPWWRHCGQQAAGNDHIRRHVYLHWISSCRQRQPRSVHQVQAIPVTKPDNFWTSKNSNTRRYHRERLLGGRIQKLPLSTDLFTNIALILNDNYGLLKAIICEHDAVCNVFAVSATVTLREIITTWFALIWPWGCRNAVLLTSSSLASFLIKGLNITYTCKYM